MDKHFAQQLANLQRAASHAGRGNNGQEEITGRGMAGRGSQGGRGGWTNGVNRDERGGGGNRDRMGDSFGGRRRGGNYRYDPSRTRPRGSSHDYGGGHYRDSERPEQDGQERKRRRFHAESSFHDRGRMGGRGRPHWNSESPRHRGRGSRDEREWRGGRGFGGHRHYDRNENDRTRDNREEGNSEKAPYVPLGEIVKVAGEKYKEKLKKDEESNNVSDQRKATKRRHIALLFLTIDDLPFEHIWKEWLASYPKDALDPDNSTTDGKNNNFHKSDGILVSVICHSKFPERVKSPWLRQRHLIKLPRHILNHREIGSEHNGGCNSDNFRRARDDGGPDASGESQKSGQEEKSTPIPTFSPRLHSRRPEWGSLEITRAMIDLMEEGLRVGSSAEFAKVPNDVSLTEPVQAQAEADESAERMCKNDGIHATTTRQDVTDLRFSHKRYLSSIGGLIPVTHTDENDQNDLSSSIIPDIDVVPPIDRFIFVSESCLPVATLEEVELALFGPKENNLTETSAEPSAPISEEPESEQNKQGTKNSNSPYEKSWLNARSTPNNGYSRQLQWDQIRSQDIPPYFIWKADQWIILTRHHAESVASLPHDYLNGRYLWPAFRKCRASDEIYFPTALAILGLIYRPTTTGNVDGNNNEADAGDKIRKRKVTYCDWSMGAKNPASFTSTDWQDVALKARREGCLFARKFVKSLRRRERPTSSDIGEGNITVEDWLSVITGKT